jgi:zinc-ribbon domain
MQNVLPTLLIALAALALMSTLLWLWQSLRHAFAHVGDPPDVPSDALVSRARGSLLAEKQALLVALKDLEAERDSGKLSGDDYRELNEQYRQRARQVLRELDGMLAPHRMQAKALLASAGTLAEPARVPEPAAADGCSSCGAANDPDAVFCKKCGARLSTGAGS